MEQLLGAEQRCSALSSAARGPSSKLTPKSPKMGPCPTSSERDTLSTSRDEVNEGRKALTRSELVGQGPNIALPRSTLSSYAEQRFAARRLLLGILEQQNAEQHCSGG